MLFLQMEEKAICHLLAPAFICKNQDQAYFTDCLHFSQLTPENAIFGFHNIDNDTFLIQNHILTSLQTTYI